MQKNGEVETIYEENVVNHHRGPNASVFFVVVVVVFPSGTFKV